MEKKILIRSARGYRRGAAPPGAEESGFQIGGLFYTLPGLVVTILFSCWGLCSFFFVSGMVSTFVPVEMKRYGSMDGVIAIFMTSIPYFLNMFISPVLSFRSDRLRSRWGRRMPYILLSAPFLAVFLILLGAASPLAAWFMARFEWLPPAFPWLLIGIFSVGYQIFFLIVGTVIYYLFPDVIPQKFIGRFMAIFNLIGSAAGFLFSRWLLPLGEHYLPWLYFGIAVLYLGSIGILALTVREGEYPAVEDAGETAGFVNSVKIYFRECYSVPFYYPFFITMALSDVSTVCRTNFNFLYARNALGLSYSDFGIVTSYCGLVGVILSFPVGMLVDRFHALKIYGLGLILVIFVNFFSFFLVKDYESFLLSSLLLAVVYTIQYSSTLPVLVALLPQAQYGQFSSANALFRALFMTVIGTGGGFFLDWMGNYQYIYFWDFIFTTAAFGTFFLLYRGFQKHGGIGGYVAPVYKKSGDAVPTNETFPHCKITR